MYIHYYKTSAKHALQQHCTQYNVRKISQISFSFVYINTEMQRTNVLINKLWLRAINRDSVRCVHVCVYVCAFNER